MAEQARESWHLDKRVPVALLLGLLAQAAVVVWWGSALDTKVTDLQRRTLDLERVDDRREQEMRNVDSRLARLEANSAAQLETLRRIERILDGNLLRVPEDGERSGR